MSDILERILATKREEIAQLREHSSLAVLERRAAEQPPARGFAAALTATAARGEAAVIAEIKRASPSKGLIREDFNPGWLARDYARGGASCLSVLTDRDYFRGDDRFLIAARGCSELPVIRKDFLIDEAQVLASRGLGADCVLLIAAALPIERLAALHALALSLGMDVLVEVHDAAETDAVLSAGLGGRLLLGINNRDLRSFETRLQTTLELMQRVPAEVDIVTESGFSTFADVQRMVEAGVMRFLIGESLMRQPSPGDALAALCGRSAPPR